MKVHRALVVALGVCLGAGIQALAEDNALSDQRPDHYQPVDRKMAQEQLNHLNKNQITQQDLTGSSAELHGVKILSLSPSESNAVPASSRPAGSLKLNKLVIIDPE